MIFTSIFCKIAPNRLFIQTSHTHAARHRSKSRHWMPLALEAAASGRHWTPVADAARHQLLPKSQESDFEDKGEELRKLIGSPAYIECSSNTKQVVFDQAIRVVLQPPKQKKKKSKAQKACSIL